MMPFAFESDSACISSIKTPPSSPRTSATVEGRKPPATVLSCWRRIILKYDAAVCMVLYRNFLLRKLEQAPVLHHGENTSRRFVATVDIYKPEVNLDLDYLVYSGSTQQYTYSE